jgi:hypothetical protein
VSGIFCSTVIGGVAACLVYSAVGLLLLAVWQCAWYVLQYCCWRYGSVPDIFCSAVIGGVAVCVVYSAVALLAV